MTGFFARVRRILLLGQRRERLKFALRSALQDPSLYPLETYPRFDVRLCLRNFLRNLAVMQGYVKTQGSQCLIYLQPLNGYGARRMSARDRASVEHLRRRVTVDGVNEWDAMREFYSQAAADFRRRGSEEFQDLTGVFDQCPGTSDVYIDQVHCSDKGYDLIARRMAEDILKREGPAPAHPDDRSSQRPEAEAEYRADILSGGPR